jgi:hypothetical protein
MKTFLLSILTALAGLALTAQLQSQAPAAPKTPLEQLRTVKAQNQQLLEKQTATIVKLDELQKEAAQIRFMSKRG